MSDKNDHRLRLTLRQLEVFEATARAGSTRAAAERVARSQSASSASLAALEEVVGAQLFDRVGRRLVLNDNGRALLPMTVSVLEHAFDLQARFSNERAPPLRIASSFTIGEYLLPPILAEWKSAHPRLSARLIIGNTSEVIDAVAAHKVDIGFIEGRKRHPNLTVRRWRNDELVVFAAPSHPLAGQKAGIADLSALAWVVREPGSGTREACDRLLLDRIADPQIALELGSSEAVKRVVAAGVGVGCLSRHAVAEAVAEGWLVEIQTRLPKMTRVLSIVSPRERPLRGAAEEFVRACMANA